MKDEQTSMNKSIVNFLNLPVFMAVASCSAFVTNKPDSALIVSESSLTKYQTRDTIAVDSNQVSKAVLTSIYVMAINDYIDAILQKDKTVFDTLFLIKRKNGQPDDFPNIELPETINGTNLILFSQHEANNNKRSYRKSSPCINLMGWVNNSKAEFIFVTFYPNFDHQFDCYSNYIFNSTKNEYDLQKLTIEVLIRDKNGKADHFAIYQAGKYIGDKPVN